MSTISTSLSNIYSIMDQPGYSMKNIDSQKALSNGSEMQKEIQDTQQAAEKGTTEGFKETLHQLNLLV